MDHKEEENKEKSFTEDKKPMTLPEGYKPNWFYFLFLFFILFTLFNRSSSKLKEISWLTFEQTMLSAHDVSKIVEVNKEFAEIYIKKDRLSVSKYKNIPQGRFMAESLDKALLRPGRFDRHIYASLGGRAAEEIIFKEISSGALDDLEKVTKQAYTMVAYYGLNDKIGPMSFYDSTGFPNIQKIVKFLPDCAHLRLWSYSVF